MNDVKIRMIFCDVDGTLLHNGDSAISNDVFKTINRAKSSNINICIASGRSYSDLRALFSPVEYDVIFICNDGALVVERENILFSSPLDKNMLACMAKTYKKDYDAFILYSKDDTYCVSDKKDFDFCKKISPQEIPSVSGDIYKVAFYNLSQRAKIKLDNLGIKSGILNKVYEDTLWTEYIKAHTDKGTAAQAVQKIYDVSISETAAFGDNLNDLNMLRRAQFSYAPKSAHHEVIKMCKYTTNDVNNEISNIISER